MNQLSSQFAIIDKIKNLVRKTGNIFKGDKTVGITEAIARKIQKGAYEAAQVVDKDSKTPPYKTIAEQLQSKDEQIYKASVYMLRNIAINEKKNRAEIIQILEKSADKKKKIEDLYNYTLQKIKEIKNIKN